MTGVKDGLLQQKWFPKDGIHNCEKVEDSENYCTVKKKYFRYLPYSF